MKIYLIFEINLRVFKPYNFASQISELFNVKDTEKKTLEDAAMVALSTANVSIAVSLTLNNT
jgi:hypothetical protein